MTMHKTRRYKSTD